jgi:hypothetical protein
MKTQHVHQFKPRKQTVLLAAYRPESGTMTYQNTVGKDILKQLVCKCGRVETVDLERTVA